jgi:hypothetical protein
MKREARVSPQALARLLFDCDAVRVVRAGGRRFLLIGYKRRSEGEWFKNGEPLDFTYTEEHCVAMGDTVQLLQESLLEYYRLAQLTMEDYLVEHAERVLQA